MHNRTRLPRAIAVALAATLSFAWLADARPAVAAPQTSNLPTLNITLADTNPEHNTINYVHASKDNKVPTTMTLEGSHRRLQHHRSRRG